MGTPTLAQLILQLHYFIGKKVFPSNMDHPRNNIGYRMADICHIFGSGVFMEPSIFRSDRLDDNWSLNLL